MTTYSISLDDVDLALLPLRAGTNDFLKKEHFQFQLLARDSDQDRELNKKQPCYICAIEVPAAFWGAHCASAKHRANARIAAAAAQRTSALITATPPPHTPPAAGRFCDSCTCIADENHEKTKEHQISVIHDRMLCDLVKVYTGDEGFETKAEADHLTTKNENKDTIRKATVQHVINEVNTTKHEDINGKHEPPTSSQTHKLDNDTYIKLLKIPSFPKITIQSYGENIQILVNNQKINVSSDNFHGYHRIGSKIQCRVCCCTIDNTEEETHKLSMIHMKRIMEVVDDCHCIRKIYTNWSHCILCNLVFTNNVIESHKVSMFHTSRQTTATVPQSCIDDKQVKGELLGNTNSKPEVNQANQQPSEAKNTGVEAKNNGPGAKKTGDETENTGAPSNFENAPNQNCHMNKSKPGSVYRSREKIEYPYEATKFLGSVYCVLCNCDVPNTPSNKSGHLKGARHAYSMKNVKN